MFVLPVEVDEGVADLPQLRDGDRAAFHSRRRLASGLNLAREQELPLVGGEPHGVQQREHRLGTRHDGVPLVGIEAGERRPRREVDVLRHPAVPAEAVRLGEAVGLKAGAPCPRSTANPPTGLGPQPQGQAGAKLDRFVERALASGASRWEH